MPVEELAEEAWGKMMWPHNFSLNLDLFKRVIKIFLEIFILINQSALIIVGSSRAIDDASIIETPKRLLKTFRVTA